MKVGCFVFYYVVIGTLYCRVEQLVACLAHNQKVVLRGSIPTPAPKGHVALLRKACLLWWPICRRTIDFACLRNLSLT